MKLTNANVGTCNNNTRIRIHSKAAYALTHALTYMHNLAESHTYARTFQKKSAKFMRQ